MPAWVAAMAMVVNMELTNLAASGDYPGAFEVGSPPQQVNLLLDTGSSALGSEP
ncbi:MAG: pepsin-like aspartyl protease [Myxococcota bacterium]